MRTLEQLEKNYEEIWLKIDDDVAERFSEEVNKIGYVFMNGESIEARRCGGRMGLTPKDKTAGYVSGMCWHYSFTHPQAVISVSHERAVEKSNRIAINYKAFISGEEKFVYKFRGDELFPLDEINNLTVYDNSVKLLDLSEKIKKILEENNIETIKQLHKLGHYGCLELKGIGEAGANKIYKALLKFDEDFTK